MKAVRILGVFAIGLFFFQSCKTGGSGEGVLLKLNLQEGKTYECTLITDSEAEVMGMSVPTDLKIYYTSTVESVSENEFVLASTYNRFTLDQEIPMQGKVSYDSDNPDAGGGMMAETYNKAFGGMIGKSLKTTMDETGKVVKTEGMDDLAGSGAEQQMTQQADLGAQMSAMSAIFPEKEIKEGDTWTGSSKGTSQVPIIMNNTYTVKEITSSEVIIELEGKVDLDEEADLPSQVGSVEVTGDVSGTMTVDRKTGWTKKVEMQQDMDIKMTQMGGMPMKVKSTITLTTK